MLFYLRDKGEHRPCNGVVGRFVQSCPDRRYKILARPDRRFLKLVAKPMTLHCATLVDAYPAARRTAHVNSMIVKTLMLRLAYH